MTPELIDEAVVNLLLLAGFLVVLGVGGLVADYVFPAHSFYPAVSGQTSRLGR